MMLTEGGKYAEAAELLEKAVADAPDRTSLRLALGSAYARSGQAEKALPHLIIAADAAEKAQPPNPMQLNNIAYTLADSGLNLPQAGRMIASALQMLDESAAKPDNDRGMQLQLTRSFGMLWDTAGWVDFKSGNLSRAEAYVHAAWVMEQNGEVGEHLVEIYEKQGRAKDAAHLCELVNVATADKVILGRIASKYRKLTGKEMATPGAISIKRLPNGEWPVTPMDELMRLRTVTLGKEHGTASSATLDVVFTAGKPPKVIFRSGDAEMKALIPRIEQAKFQVMIPDGSHATLLREATAVCSKYVPCTVVLNPLSMVVR